MKYCVFFFDLKNGTYCMIGIGYTKEQADIEVGKMREQDLPAFKLTHDEFRKLFKEEPKMDKE